LSLDRRIKDRDLDTDQFNFANDERHRSLIVAGIENLLITKASTGENATTLLADIICNDKYGKFSQLAAYDWLMRCNVKITTEVALPSTQILGTNTSILDGMMDHLGVYFDVKAFGLNGRLANRLKERLEPLVGETVILEKIRGTFLLTHSRR
jgi:hypothetical protein